MVRLEHVVAGVVYMVYVLTAFSNVPGGDSGELLAEACQLGTSHPPGYPLFNMMSHLVSTVPVPRLLVKFSSSVGIEFSIMHEHCVAWRVNHFCCILGAATAGLVCAIGKTIFKVRGSLNSHFLCAIGSLGYAFTPLVWEYSTTAEVFALNNFICALLLNALCVILVKLVPNAPNLTIDGHSTYETSNTNRVLSLALYGGVYCGLALSNQHSSLLMVAYVVPCVLVSVYIYARALFGAVFLRSSAGFLLGFSSYAYLPLAAAVPTMGSWGNLRTVEGFFRHVLRTEYGTFRLGMIVGSETAFERIVIYLAHTSRESFHLLFPVLLMAGAVMLMAAVVSPTKAVAAPAQPTAAIDSTMNKQTLKKSKHNKERIENKPSPCAVPVLVPPQAAAWSVSGILVANLVAMWLFYVLVWHCVLSNLPLSAPMPFAVHSRFWMQPNIILYALLSAALGYLASLLPLLRREGLQAALVIVYLAVVLYQRWPEMDKSTAGDVLHRYAAAKLASIMPPAPSFIENNHTTPATAINTRVPLPHSLLLSHTDLDWNPVRYLQHCEGVGMDPTLVSAKSPLRHWLPGTSRAAPTGLVTHLSFQLIPYPWFPLTQAPLYPHLTFPSTNFPGVSADRLTEGNAQLILRFLQANRLRNESFLPSPRALDPTALLASTHGVFTGGVYLDMQGVNEAEIDTFGIWREQTLVPWGTLYRVFGSLSLAQIQELHHHSLHQLRQLQAHFPVVDDTFVRKFTAGSWERAAANVFYDAHYQFGLNVLTYSIEVQGQISMDLLPVLLDRYLVAATVLLDTLHAVRKYDTFSSSKADLIKNTALAWMRLNSVMSMADQFGGELKKGIKKRTGDVPLEQQLLDPAAVRKLLASSGRAEVARHAKTAIGIFLKESPQDRDHKVFANVFAKL